MLEGSGSVFLDKEMAEPSGAIAGNQSKRKQEPSAGSNEEHSAGDSDRRAYQMKQASGGFAVFCQVMRPEFGE